MKRLTCAALVSLLAGTAAAGEITVSAPWIRASTGSPPESAGFMTIRSTAPDHLIGASSPRAGRVELTIAMEHAGVVTVRRLSALAIAPDRPAVLQPGGLHLRLTDIAEPLLDGESVPLELTFERAGTIAFEAVVVDADGAGD